MSNGFVGLTMQHGTIELQKYDMINSHFDSVWQTDRQTEL